MATRTFLEIVFVASDFVYEGRDEIEDPLQEALETSGLGEVTGGGGGMGVANIDVEVIDLERGLAVVRRVLQELGVASSTVINQYKPSRAKYLVYL